MSEDNIEQQPVEQEQKVELNDVLEQKVNFFSLPKTERVRLQNEYYETLPEEDREIFREKGYAPPQMFGGKNRQGEHVDAKTPEEFKRDFIDKKKRSYTNELDSTKQELSQVKKQIEEMSNLLKMQTSVGLKTEERTLAEKINQAKYEGNFELYDQLKQEQFELNQRKNQITTPVTPPTQEYAYSPEERVAIDEFKDSHVAFVDSLKRNSVLRNSFDGFLKTIASNDPSLSPKEVLNRAKKAAENVFPDIVPKQQPNVFMNNQYSSQAAPPIIKKPDTKSKPPRFENMSHYDQVFIRGEAKRFPGKTFQEVVDVLYSTIGKK
jgi:hypothetical protein